MSDNRLEQLKRKYAAVLRVIEQVGIRLQDLRVQDDKLFLRGEALDQEAKMRFRDYVKLVDPDYQTDLVAEITVSPTARPAVPTLHTNESWPGVAQTYRVQEGDTLAKIAQQFYGDANQYMKIFNANSDHLTDPDKIHVGQLLRIPD